METVIYMPLVGEGTDCWRSVRALRIANDIFEVIEHIPSGESWKFAPFSRVRCRNRIFTDDEPGLEAFEYALESDPNYRLLKAHEKESFRIIFKNGEEAIVRVIHVDGHTRTLFMSSCPPILTEPITALETMRPTSQNLLIWYLPNEKHDIVLRVSVSPWWIGFNPLQRNS